MTITASATAIFRSLNPAPEEITAEYPAMTEAQVEAAPASAESPFQVNRRQPDRRGRVAGPRRDQGQRRAEPPAVPRLSSSGQVPGPPRIGNTAAAGADPTASRASGT